ncbi:hypothetical protein BGW80DRAFT_1268402 [Lactifluus volemus]|nr:hypothetical protein BGW80DRAFT_1268402 [Lactifluus volemus]
MIHRPHPCLTLFWGGLMHPLSSCITTCSRTILCYGQYFISVLLRFALVCHVRFPSLPFLCLSSSSLPSHLY